MDGHRMLEIFLPILIFASAFDIDPYVFKKCFAQILCLAVVGLIIATIMTGVTVNTLGIIDPDRRTPFALPGMLFGAMISATDPVAIVALLGELGASAKMKTIVEVRSRIWTVS